MFELLEIGSAFFAKRFADMDWMIATPRLTAQFRGGRDDRIGGEQHAWHEGHASALPPPGSIERTSRSAAGNRFSGPQATNQSHMVLVGNKADFIAFCFFG